MEYFLECRYDSRASFYKKAKVVEKHKMKELYSYGTLVAFISDRVIGKTIYKYLGKYSQTTTRHQKEFFRQNGLDDKQIKELFDKGVLEVR